MTAPKLIASIASANTLGEGVLWDARQQVVLWTDVEERAICRARAPFDAFERFETPARIGSFGLVREEATKIVAAFENGFAAFEYETGRVDWLDRPRLPPGVRFNDGRVDREGVFWAGTMVERGRGDHGALFRLGGEGRAEQAFAGVRISNGLAWSPDGAVMYFADSPRRVIWAFDFIDGRPVNRRVFAQTTGGAYPDGACIDAEGFLWSAHWGGGAVVRYAPDGRLDLRVEVPAPNATCPAFGGEDLSLLFVASARAELDDAALAAAPRSGDLFVYETPYRGLPEQRCLTGV